MSNPTLAPGASGYLGSLLCRVRASRMARQAAWLFGLNTVAKGLAFVGSAYAARCLGPANLGVSALILSLSQLVVVLAGGGLDTVAVRRIAARPSCARSITMTIVRFRAKVLGVILPLGLLCALIISSGEHTLAWSAGAFLPLVTSLGLVFVFQGLEKLPLQGMISLLVSGIAAGAYFLFQPGMPAGSDLAVMALSGLVGVFVSFHFLAKLTHKDASEPMPDIGDLLTESRPYWLLALVVYCYSTLQIPLVGYLVGKEALGAYRSALLLATGLELFYNSINSLLLPRLVVWREQGSAYLWRRQKELFVLFLGVGSLVSLAVILLAPGIYHRFLGEAFSSAILPFQILVVGRLVVFVGQIFAWSLPALHLDRKFLQASVAGAIVCVVGISLVVPRFGLSGAAMVAVLSETIVCSLCFRAVRTHLHGPGQNL